MLISLLLLLVSNENKEDLKWKLKDALGQEP